MDAAAPAHRQPWASASAGRSPTATTDAYLASISLFGFDSLDYKSAEVGYRTHPDARGRGVLTRSLRAVIGACVHPRGRRRPRARADQPGRRRRQPRLPGRRALVRLHRDRPRPALLRPRRRHGRRPDPLRPAPLGVPELMAATGGLGPAGDVADVAAVEAVVDEAFTPYIERDRHQAVADGRPTTPRSSTPARSGSPRTATGRLRRDRAGSRATAT